MSIFTTSLQVDIIYLKKQGKLSTEEIADRLGCHKRYVYQVWSMYRKMDKEPVGDKYDKLLTHTVNDARKLQKARDQQRIERKIRSKIRRENAVEAYTEELISLLRDKSFKPRPIKRPRRSKKAEGIIQISDTHFNELISLPSNQYDFKVASKRLQKLAHEARTVFSAYDITHVTVAITGDLLNSDRRLDELLNMATNRSKATLLSVVLLEYFLMELFKYYKVTVCNICGNEGRANKEHAHSEFLMSYNYDYNVVEILKLIMRKTDIRFIDSHPTEQIISVCDKNILMLHGDQFRGGAQQTQAIQKVIGKYSVTGTRIDYCIFGHLHETRIGDFYSRSASLAGANAYSENGLQLMSRAAQNIHIIRPDSINTMKIDLQDTENYKGYPIDKNLEAYNAKSFDKIKRLRVPKI